MLPNLLVIGAPKAGTTSLHSYLGQHPDIFMSETKELRYFWRDDWKEQRSAYEANFQVDARVRGESTPTYAAWPFLLHVPERAAELIPNAKLIYLVRDPVERVASHWVQRAADGDKMSLACYLEQLERPDNPLVCTSRYMMQIHRYLAYFGQDRLLVVDQDDLKHRREETVCRVFEFLGVDPKVQINNLHQELNVRTDKLIRRRLTKVACDEVLWPASRRLPEAVKRPLRRPASRAFNHVFYRRIIEPPELHDDERSRLRDYFRPDVQRLRYFTGQAFASWSL